MSDIPLVVHVVHSLGVGGLENGLVNIVNHMSPARYRHALVCMTHSGDFERRIARADVPVIAMRRGSVPLWRTYLDLFAVFRRLRPSIVHTRNLSGLDALLPALCAGVRVRIHGEHGRDADDLGGSNPKYRRLRRAFRSLVTHYTAVSKDLERYLIEQIGIAPARIDQIYNGVDIARYRPADIERADDLAGGGSRRALRFGTVGRLQAVKDQVTLVRAFAQAARGAPDAMREARLVIGGDGPSRAEIEDEIRRSGMADRIDLLGQIDDVAALLRSFDVFVLPSRDEGISNTILEAMASGLPVLATRVGGNPELVREGDTGQLVESGDPCALARWLVRYAQDTALRRAQGRAARIRAEGSFSLQSMVDGYAKLYDELLAARPRPSGDSVKKSMILP
ncbi:MAG: TIGR03088 family PEP-CTERM/XrtA system glycosyltransferase [Burkholderiales bacterium]|nr:TIGR03088 family PEP-CTERM/XrtA system glycosyltransferase [Burkholderiales bacterium]